MFLQQRHFSYETKEATDFAVKDQDLLSPHLPGSGNYSFTSADLGFQRQHLSEKRLLSRTESRASTRALRACSLRLKSCSRAHTCYDKML